MAVTSARSIVNLKEKGHFEHKNENERIDHDKYTLADELPSRLSALEIRSMRPSYTVRKLYQADKEAVLQFLARFFFRDEPMNRAVKLLETPTSRCIELEEYATLSLDDEVSVAAFDDNGHIVGLIINGISRREVTNSSMLDWEREKYIECTSLSSQDRAIPETITAMGWQPEVDYTDKSSECPDPKFAKILKVLGHLDREAKIWEKLPPSCHTVLEVRIASTHSDWRGRGLMRILCEESERIAKSIGAGALRMDATSAFSAAAAERLGYKSVYSVLYSDLPYAPQPEAPHLEARVYIKEV